MHGAGIQSLDYTRLGHVGSIFSRRSLNHHPSKSIPAVFLVLSAALCSVLLHNIPNFLSFCFTQSCCNQPRQCCKFSILVSTLLSCKLDFFEQANCESHPHASSKRILERRMSGSKRVRTLQHSTRTSFATSVHVLFSPSRLRSTKKTRLDGLVKRVRPRAFLSEHDICFSPAPSKSPEDCSMLRTRTSTVVNINMRPFAD